MNEATQRLLPAGLVTLVLHGAFLSWQMENMPIHVPTPPKISVTLRNPPPPPPPQQRLVKHLPPPPQLQPVEHKPLPTLPPPQHKVVKQRKALPEVKPVQRTPVEQLPPAQNRIARRLLSPPPVAPAALRPLETLPPAQSRILRQLPRISENLTVAQSALRPIETLPPLPEPELIVEEEVFEEVRAEERVPTEPVYEEVVVEESLSLPQDDAQAPSSRQQYAESSASVSPSAGDQEAAPLYASNPPPEYPMQARRRGLQGVVIVEALIDTKGTVSDLRLARSSGHSILDTAALRSVQRWRFQPGTVGGRQTAMWVNVPVRFELH